MLRGRTLLRQRGLGLWFGWGAKPSADRLQNWEEREREGRGRWKGAAPPPSSSLYGTLTLHLQSPMGLCCLGVVTPLDLLAAPPRGHSSYPGSCGKFSNRILVSWFRHRSHSLAKGRTFAFFFFDARSGNPSEVWTFLLLMSEINVDWVYTYFVCLLNYCGNQLGRRQIGLLFSFFLSRSPAVHFLFHWLELFSGSVLIVRSGS